MLKIAINAALEAAQAICKVYNSDDFHIQIKSDNSPLTDADKQSHQIIAKTLEKTVLPILSEEGKHLDYNIRKKWRKFWLVDPLDGTKEFIKRNGEFTVNIALINNRLPVLGVIYIPTKKILYFAEQELGSYKVENFTDPVENIENLVKNATKLPSTFPGGGYIVLASRSHMNEQTERYIDDKISQCPSYQIITVGSSIKFCLIAEGIAHEYPRFGPTMEWDTAAGHAIVKFSGGQVIRAEDGKELEYNKENLVNPDFIVKSMYLDR